MLDYAGCWNRFWFLIKYINYEILLQRITSLCPTREWFVLQLTGGLYGVHLQLISRGGRRSRQAGILGQCKGPIWCQSWTEERAPAKAPSQAGRCLFNILPVWSPSAREVFVTSWTRACERCFFNTHSHLPPLCVQAQHKHSLFQEGLSDSFRCSESQPFEWFSPWPNCTYVGLWFVLQAIGHSLTSSFFIHSPGIYSTLSLAQALC